MSVRFRIVSLVADSRGDAVLDESLQINLKAAKLEPAFFAKNSFLLCKEGLLVPSSRGLLVFVVLNVELAS